MESPPSSRAPQAASVPLTFVGGAAGALAPVCVFVLGVAALAYAGAPDERGFWPVLLLGLGVGLLLAQDRGAYAEAMLDGMSDRLVATMILAWLLSGVMAAVLGASGVIGAIAGLAREAGLTGGGYVAVAMLASALVSMATGTSFGTLMLCGPLLYPAGGAAGAAPAPLLGAILAGATFGDSLSPISDTTIASSGSQGVDIGGTVRARLKYAVPAGLMALLVLAAVGGADAPGTGLASRGASLPPVQPFALTMLAAPTLALVLLWRGRSLVEGLMAGVAATIALGLVTGLVAPSALLRVDAAAFGARGLVSDGLSRGVGVSVFTMLLMALVEPLKRSGVIARVAEPRGASSSVRATEGWIVAVVSAAVLLTTHSVVAILSVGDVVRGRGAAAGVDGYRRANLLDLTVCTWPFLLPWFLPTILASGVTRDAATYGMPAIAPWRAGMWNGYAWALVAMVAWMVLAGYGRSLPEQRAEP
ncbi:MAG: Na+/H+ antiporter NhaC family protein [Gemmatimonadaceae bacterium]|nr:Na+/H+ antiporter NhaC family protein [Gemmatimonadaceae bacterium]